MGSQRKDDPMKIEDLDLTQVNISAVQEWINALRSGNYRQGKNALARSTAEGTEYCCMGVACEIAPFEDIKGLFTTNLLFLYDNENMVMPLRVRQWLFGKQEVVLGNPYITSMDVEHEFFDNESSLAELKDAHGWTFDEIAEVIEQAILEPAKLAQAKS